MNKDELAKDVEGWKGSIDEENKGSLEWEKDLIFTARTQRGYEVDFDAGLQWGCSPTETFLISLAGCMAIDVTFFLKKMRADIKTFKIDFSGTRNLTPPQYYKSMDLTIKISGNGLTPKKMDRAISLSQEKYCSVYHSLREDIKVNVNYEIIENTD